VSDDEESLEREVPQEDEIHATIEENSSGFDSDSAPEDGFVLADVSDDEEKRV